MLLGMRVFPSPVRAALYGSHASSRLMVMPMYILITYGVHNITCTSHVYHMYITCISHVYHMYIMHTSRVHHAHITCVSHVHHVTYPVVWEVLIDDLPHLCLM